MTIYGRTLAAACVLALCGCEPKQPGPGPATRTAEPARRPAPGLLAAVGRSARAEPAAAATEAAGQAMAHLRAAGVRPAGAIFLDRAADTSPKRVTAIGRCVRRLTGAATCGHGTTPTGREPAVTVLVLGGEGIDVRGFATSGALAGGDPNDTAAARALRRARAERGDALGRQISAAADGGIVLTFGALDADAHASFQTALHKRLRGGAALAGGVGTRSDAVYLPGRPTSVGQLAVVIRGPVRLAVEPVALSNRWDAGATRAEARAAMAAAVRRIAPSRPSLLLTFGRDEHNALLADRAGDVPIFAVSCTGQAGTDASGKLHAGTGRLIVAALAAQ